MSQHGQQPESAANPFDAAKAIVEALKGLDKTSQVLAFRFAGETLGLQAAPSGPGPLAVGVSATPQAIQSNTQRNSTDIKQFTAAKAPKSDQQFAAVVAYFYRFEAPETQRRETIDADALQEAARLAGRKRPPKPGMTLLNAKNQGYLDAAGNGLFRISSVGENLVAIALPGNGSESPSRRRTKRKGIGKVKTDADKAAIKKRTEKTAKAGK